MALTPEMMLVLALLVFTVILFVFDIIRTDVTAMLVLGLLGATTLIPGLTPLLSPEQLLGGFSSNAVVAIIAVMIIGAGLDKTGLMTAVAARLIKLGGHSERRLIGLLTGVAGLFSSFVQNVGVIALFMPVAARIATRTEVPLARLLLPLAFCTILGGTITMIGCSPLILLNDLIIHINSTLAPSQRLATFHLLDVAPVGLALLATGIVFFVTLGPRLLPPPRETSAARRRSTLEFFKRVYDLDAAVYEVVIPTHCPLIGKPIMDIENAYRLRVIASRFQGTTRIAPPVSVQIEAPAVLGIVAQAHTVQRFAKENGLLLRTHLSTFADALVQTEAGVAELIIPPDSSLIGKTTFEIRMRVTYGLTVLAIHRAGKNISSDIENAPPLGEIPFQAGDSLVCHTRWENLARLEKDRDFVIVTADYPREERRPHKAGFALFFFALSLGLVLFSHMPLSIALLIGATGMVLSHVLSMDEAYSAVSWKTVFLLAGLIPLGQAVQSSGTAAWIAQQVLLICGDLPAWGLQTVLAVLATGFSLVMSNVGATVLLVPLAVNIALSVGADPALFAITVALATSNAFLIPTNQVNALVVGPGGYSVADFIKAGSLMSLLFLVVSLLVLNGLFLLR